MKTYLDYKNQIQGFQDVSETVKVMEKIAASSVHFLKEKVAALNSYTQNIEHLLVRLSVFYTEKNHPLLRSHLRGAKVVVVITADKGLVGSLWHNLINELLKDLKNYKFIIMLGAKGDNYLKEEGVAVSKFFPQIYNNVPEYDIKKIANFIFTEFSKEKFSQVDILYPQFVSLSEQRPNLATFLPFRFALPEAEKNNKVSELNSNKPVNKSPGFPIFEPTKKMIFDQLLKEYIKVFFHKIIIETKLSELSARTISMEDAASKTSDLMKKLEIAYIKERHKFATQKELESFSAHKTLV